MPLGRRFGRILEVLAGVLVVFVVVTLALGAYLNGLSKTLPDLDASRIGASTPRTSIVYAADGSVLAEWHGEQDRTVVGLDDMPKHLRDAVVAIEDQRFYQHNGVDIEAIARALRANTEAQAVRQGGSTITQQLVKILFTEGERTLTRKIREALMAYELEAKTDKDRVLEVYLNTVYFGNGAYGVESAASRYFGKRAASLTLAESAMLAGIIRAPVRYDPVDDAEAAQLRRNVVLAQLRDQGYISEDQARQAQRAPLGLNLAVEKAKVAPFFVEHVKRDLIDRLGAERVYGGGLRVHTTLDPAAQRAAERAAKMLSARGDPEVALVAIEHKTGRVVAMVGGRNFTKSQFNLASQGLRQPGSAFKTFVLAAALEQGVAPDKTYNASPYSVRVKDGVWNVQNYENSRTSGRMTLRAATNYSVNAVYARLIMEIGPEKVAKMAKRLGIVTKVDANPAIALGGLTKGVSPLEMASAYGTLANGGMYVKPSGIEKVTDDEGRVVYEPDRNATKAVSRRVAVQASLMLHDVVERGTATEARINRVWAAGKTGTTQSYRDAWFVGWAGDISTAVWVGHPQAQVAMTNVHGIKVTGGSYPAKIWAAFMKSVTGARSKPVTPPKQPGDDSTVSVRICEDTMLLANQRCPRTVDIYLDPELIPDRTCTLH